MAPNFTYLPVIDIEVLVSSVFGLAHRQRQ